MFHRHRDVTVVLRATQDGVAAGGIETRPMNEEQQLKLQAFLDGELPERDAREITAWLQRDAAAAALFAELKATRQALAAAETPVALPESREFYWSKIARDLQALERA